MPGATIKEVLKFALKESIRKRDMERALNKRQTTDLKRHAQPAPAKDGVRALKTSIAQPNFRVPIATALKRAVWKKAQGQCCYRHNGRRCSSRFQLQIDHIVPFAKGGSNDVSNFHLLCRQHNQLKGMN